SRPPFGYWAKPVENTAHLTRTGKPKKRLDIHDDEAKIVRTMFELYLVGDVDTDFRPVGIKAMASLLNAKGVTHRGAKWSIGTVHDLLRNPVYGGQFWYNWKTHRGTADEGTEEIVRISCPNIVSTKSGKKHAPSSKCIGRGKTAPATA